MQRLVATDARTRSLMMNQVKLRCYNALTQAPKINSIELNFSFFAGVNTRNAPSGVHYSGCQHLVHSTVPNYVVTGSGAILQKLKGQWYLRVYSPSESQRACETFNPPLLEFKLSESLKGPIKCQQMRKMMGSQNRCTSSEILTILSHRGVEFVNNLSQQGMPQRQSTLDREESLWRENIAIAVHLQQHEWEVHMLPQLINSGCVPCSKDASAEFGEKYLTKVLFALNLSFEQVQSLIPGYGSKSRFYRVCRVTSSSLVVVKISTFLYPNFSVAAVRE